MRDIKFRAWDKKGKEMFKVLRLPLSSLAGGFLLHTPITGEEMREDKNTDNYILMQYTGLKDKNGKEIYHFDYLLVVGEKRLVDWHFNRWVMRDVKTNRIDEFRKTDQVFYKVIGNIYENKELLNSPKGENV